MATASQKQGRSRRLRSPGLLLLAVGAAVLALAGGVAAADSISCTVNPCFGTEGDDYVEGTTGADEVHALGGDDTANGGTGGSDLVFGESGKDQLHGDIGFDRSLDGTDEVYGGKGADSVAAAGESDLMVGGRGPDSIDARDDLFAGNQGLVYGVDTVKGGRGNDQVFAAESAVPAEDHVDCGPGKRDEVIFDGGLDTVERCEKKSRVG